MTTKKLSEVEKLRIRMDSKFIDLKEELQNQSTKFKKIDNKLDLVLNQLDSISGQFKRFDEERELMSDKIRKHTDLIEECQNVVFAKVDQN